MTASLRDLKVWQTAVETAGAIVRIIRQHARRETVPLQQQLIAVSCRIAESIARGHTRFTAAEQRDLYRAAKEDLLVLETLIAIARHADVIPAEPTTFVTDHITTLHRLLAGYLVYLDRQLVEEKAAV